MTVGQELQTKLDEPGIDKGPTWDLKRNESVNEVASMNIETHQTGFKDLIDENQKVFLSGGQKVGRISKLLPGSEGQVFYLIIRTTHFWGRHKILPIGLVREFNPKGVWISIDRSKFQELPDYRSDGSIKEEIENALWNDETLRATDFYEINVQVINGVVTLTGHITGIINQGRIDNVIGNVKGILGVKIHLVADDKLLLNVADALTPIERIEGNHVFAKVENGVVVLSGRATSPEGRNSAERRAANVPQVRGVINNISAPGFDTRTVDQRFIQPVIGEKIFFTDGVVGIVKQVIINPDNRRVVDMIIEGPFPDKQPGPGPITAGGIETHENLAVISISLIRFLTRNSGFLTIESTEINRYRNFNASIFCAPNTDWLPPYPYHIENVMFFKG